MYWYLSFLRPPPVYLSLPADGVVITPQVANDLRTELRDTPTQIQYTWQRLPSGPSTKPVDLTLFQPPASTYRPLTVPLPRTARAGEKWRLGLLSPPASGPEGIPLLDLCADPGVLGVWSEGIELRFGGSGNPPPGVVKGVGKTKKGPEKKPPAKKSPDAPKQSRITRAWPTPAGALRLVEQTSFDLDKKVWDSGLALSAWLWKYSDAPHSHPEAQRVLGLLDGTVLEIGSGTGLVAIALAQIRAYKQKASATANEEEDSDHGDGDGDDDTANDSSASITATDLESAMEIMRENVAYNSAKVAARVLDWDAPIPAWVAEEPPAAVLAADVTYNTASFPMLVRTLTALLAPGIPLLLAYKERDAGERALWGMLEEQGMRAALVDKVQGAEDVGETEIWVIRKQ